MGLNSESVLNMASSDSQISGHPKRAEAARCKHKQVCKVLKLRELLGRFSLATEAEAEAEENLTH